MRRSYVKRHALRKAVLPASVVAVLMASSSAKAYDFDTGIPDLDVRWDNTVRYNLGLRAENCDPDICGNGKGAGNILQQQSDKKFAHAGQVVTDRVDVLSEFDVIYRQDTGIHVSAAGWYDAAYSNRVVGDSALNGLPGGVSQGAGPAGAHYSNYADRYLIGPSAELLDAFVFTKFNLGNVPVNVKLGQENIYWGESLFSYLDGVSYNQGPVDLQKAIATPGTEAQELFLPLPQFSFVAQPTSEVTLMGQYIFDWSATRLPEGGTYFGAADGIGGEGTGTVFGAPLQIIRPSSAHDYGDFGIGAKWRPEWLDGTMGFYFREYTNKFPELVMRSFATVPGQGVVPTGFAEDYDTGQREKLFGFSLSKDIAGISFGADVTYRPDAVLMATPFNTYVAPGTPASAWVPTGNVTTALVNAIKLFGKTPFFDSAPLSVELTYSTVGRITANSQNYFGQGYGCTNSSNPTMYACPTKNAWGIAVSFEPKWYQVWNGVDLSLPMFYSIGLKGNSPVLFGDNQGEGAYSIGITADIYSKYNISLKYNGFNTRHGNDQLGYQAMNNAVLGSYWDRGWVSLTFKTAF